MKTKSFWKLGLAVIFLSLSTFAFGQVREVKEPKEKTPPTKEERAQHAADRMKKDLELTDVQYKQLYELNLKYGEKMERLFDPEEHKAKMEQAKKYREEQEKELKAILNAEQYAVFEKQKQEMHTCKHKRPDGPPPGGKKDRKTPHPKDK